MSQNRFEIEDFRTITKTIGQELSWYLCYLAIEKTQNELEVAFDEIDRSPFIQSLFLYALEYNICQLLKEHVFFEDVKLSSRAFDQARTYFVIWMDDKSNLDMARYLNYLDDWGVSYQDWRSQQPVAWDDLIIVHTD